MSVDLYIITKQPVADLTPALIGLGTGAFPWPGADSPAGWRYDGWQLQLAVHGIEHLVEMFSTIEGIAPADAQSCIYFAPYWYMDGFEHTVANAFGGIATSDIELAEGPYVPSEDELADGATAPPAPAWSEPYEPAMRELRAALYADRFAAVDAPDLDARAEAAVRGDADQLAVLEKWLARGTARIHGQPQMPRASDAIAVRAALVRAAGDTPPPAIAKLLAMKQ